MADGAAYDGTGIFGVFNVSHGVMSYLRFFVQGLGRPALLDLRYLKSLQGSSAIWPLGRLYARIAGASQKC
jgi:hypothetical protein